MLGSNAGTAEGAAQAAPLPQISRDIGKMVARHLFEKRGNHTEAHLSESELAAACAAASLATIIRLEGRRG
jgi:hypothetical protein